MVDDDVIKWKYVPPFWSLVWGIHRSPVNSPHKGQWRGALMLLWSAPWINGWVHNREAGDLRRHHCNHQWFSLDEYGSINSLDPVEYGHVKKSQQSKLKSRTWLWVISYSLNMGQVTKLWLSCYLVLLSTDSKTGNKTAAVSWPDPYIKNRWS